MVCTGTDAGNRYYVDSSAKMPRAFRSFWGYKSSVGDTHHTARALVRAIVYFNGNVRELEHTPSSRRAGTHTSVVLHDSFAAGRVLRTRRVDGTHARITCDDM